MNKSGFNNHCNSVKMAIVDHNNISSEHLNGSSLHLNRHRKGNLIINLIRKISKTT